MSESAGPMAPIGGGEFMPQSSFASLRNRFGISTKLQVAFCAAGAMSLLAGVVAIGSFSASETEFHRVTGTQVPLMVEALQLSASVGEVSAEAARFISAANTEDQRRIAALINRKSADLTSVLERLRAEYRADETLAHVQEVSRQLGDNLQLLETTITQRSQLRAKLNTGLSELYKVRLQIHDQLVPVIDDAYFDAVTAAENLARGSETERTVEARIWGLRNALEIETQAQVATGVISEAAIVRDEAALVPLRDRFKAAASLLEKRSSSLPANVRDLVRQLVNAGIGADDLFTIRGRELAARIDAEHRIEANVSIHDDLDRAVSDLVRQSQAAMASGSSALIQDLDRNRNLLFMCILVGLGTVLTGAFYVQRRLIPRLASIRKAMQRLSSGEISSSIPAVADTDEVGEMARSLEVFRASEIERRKLVERSQAEQAAERERSAAIEQLIAEFRATVTKVIASVDENVGRMNATAHTLTDIAAKANQQSRAASDCSTETSSNVQAVASATDQLGSSIQEVAAQASQARAVVAQATEMAEAASSQIERLSESVHRIDDVIKLIHAIAQQTNLLALNATIESARAGAAGRGFAIVASEVKTLAARTANATDEIGSHISAIQQSTADAVVAIRTIGGVMAEINQSAAAIAAAVDQQSASTHEIARNTQYTADRANELSTTMSTVTGAIAETNQSARQVSSAASALTEQAGTLQRAVEGFLSRVAAA